MSLLIIFQKLAPRNACSRNPCIDFVFSVQCIFSSGKTIASIVIATLVEKGLLDYDAKVCSYWPEFKTNGKEDITLADVLRHESGLAWIDHTFKIDDS